MSDPYPHVAQRFVERFGVSLSETAYANLCTRAKNDWLIARQTHAGMSHRIVKYRGWFIKALYHRKLKRVVTVMRVSKADTRQLSKLVAEGDA